MADGQASPPGARKRIPPYVWLLGAAGIAGAYLLWRRSQSNAAATAATAPPVAASGSYGNAGDLAALAPYLQAAGNSGTGQGSGATYTPPTGEVAAGSGYYNPGSSAPIPGADNYSYQWVSQPQAQAATSSGQVLYYQPVPGTFLPVPPGLKGLAKGTPQFLRQGGSPVNTQ